MIGLSLILAYVAIAAIVGGAARAWHERHGGDYLWTAKERGFTHYTTSPEIGYMATFWPVFLCYLVGSLTVERLLGATNEPR